mmetsp:Transcript_7588/g.16622  ORF Transcript_7588/g.16622 Transcript_7588/m.16622 type:complete len:234 (+) Transcript_7588:68-769(+)
MANLDRRLPLLLLVFLPTILIPAEQRTTLCLGLLGLLRRSIGTAKLVLPRKVTAPGPTSVAAPMEVPAFPATQRVRVVDILDIRTSLLGAFQLIQPLLRCICHPEGMIAGAGVQQLAMHGIDGAAELTRPPLQHRVGIDSTYTRPRAAAAPQRIEDVIPRPVLIPMPIDAVHHGELSQYGDQLAGLHLNAEIGDGRSAKDVRPYHLDHIGQELLDGKVFHYWLHPATIADVRG